MYEMNDVVLYNANVCRITEITEKEISGTRADYYVLMPVYDNTIVIYIPVDNETTTAKMRRILTVDEIDTLISAMPDQKTIWIENGFTRKARYREIIAEGNRTELASLIKTLDQQQKSHKEKNKKLLFNDGLAMKEAKKMLYEEFAYVYNIKPDQVSSFIIDKIEEERKKIDIGRHMDNSTSMI